MTDSIANPQSRISNGHWPAVTCLCPTYGRFQLLREALACFLAQDYPGEKRILILSDAPKAILPSLGMRVRDLPGFIVACDDPLLPGVEIWCRPNAYPNLGHKRQALLQMAGGGHGGPAPTGGQSAIENPKSAMVVAHWDDDDLYLPWHLSRSVAALLGPVVEAWLAVRPFEGLTAPSNVEGGPHRPEPLSTEFVVEGHCRRAVPGASSWGCVKSRGAWYVTGPRSALQNNGIHHNVFEGSMVFWRDEALALGGYPPLHSGQAKALMDAFAKAGRLYAIPDDDPGAPVRFARMVSTQDGKPCGQRCAVSYVYRWAQGCGHISAMHNKPDSLARFQAQNTDFGDGSPLTPADLTPYWEALNLSHAFYLPAGGVAGASHAETL